MTEFLGVYEVTAGPQRLDTIFDLLGYCLSLRLVVMQSAGHRLLHQDHY